MCKPAHGEVVLRPLRIFVHDRTEAGVAHRIVDRAGALHLDRFRAELHRFFFSVEVIGCTGFVGPFESVPVEHVLPDIGKPPGYLFVEADHQGRHPGQTNAVGVELGGMQLDLVPDRRQGEFEMRVVTQDRRSVGRFRAG